MIRRSFDVKHYWKVIVYYIIDYDFFDIIAEEMYSMGSSRKTIDSIYHTMISGKGKAFTYSNLEKHTSIVCFNNHANYYDYINSVVHEAEHIKQAMLEAYKVDDKGELPAYTIGYLVQQIIISLSPIVYNCQARLYTIQAP